MPAGSWRWLAALLLLLVVYVTHLDGVGLLGPDEPRYASIGREMAQSGDWVTPRLWGSPWFEKPALLYWMTGLAFSAGLGPELAPRLPVALFSLGFLVFFFLVLRKEFGECAALFATGILATSAGWIAFSRLGVTDLPLAAAFSAAMLCAMLWYDRDDYRYLLAGSALMALAVLAKGLVAPALSLPAFWFFRRKWRDRALFPAALVFLAVSVPWYALATWRYGRPFLEEFFVRHHLARFTTESLQHQQPFWYYLPVLVAGLFPWCPLVALLFARSGYRDRRRLFLLAWVIWGLVFLSVSVNKLPGYVLPLLPGLAALAGIALSELERPRWWIAASGLLLGLLPLVAEVMPVAIRSGISRASVGGPAWYAGLAALPLGAMVWWLAQRGRTVAAFGCVSAAALLCVVYLEVRTFPALDELVSARRVWEQVQPHAAETCAGNMHRSLRYCLNYYSGMPLPDCSTERKAFRVWEEKGRGLVTGTNGGG